MAKRPLFYVNLPSISDQTMAPQGKEACFILIPIAPGLEDTRAARQVLQYRAVTNGGTHQPTHSGACAVQQILLCADFKSDITPIKAMPMAWQTP